MARRRQEPKAPERARLLVPLADARTRIQAQLDRGETVPDVSINENDAARKWYDFTSELLRQICSNDELQDEFTGRSSFGGYGEINTGSYLKTLRSIYERLELLPSPEASTGPAAAKISETVSPRIDTTNTRNVFVVHGHDDEMKQHVARTLSQLKLNPIILHEKPNSGRTIIEKFEANADVSFAVVLLSPDDMAYSASGDAKHAKPRARQNVVMELGYFVGRLSRKHVFCLKRGDNLEIPSDFSGVIYTPYDAAGHWKIELVRELKEAEYSVDANHLI